MNTLVQILQPSIILTIGAFVVLFLGLSSAPGNRRMLPGLTVLSLVIAFCVIPNLSDVEAPRLVSPDGALRAGPVINILGYLTLEIAVLLTLIGWWPDREDIDPRYAISGEFFALMLMSVTGAVLIFNANNLIVLFLALELASIPTYIMVAISRPHLHAREAGLKYFLLGALSAALIAYGFSFMYGITGTISLPDIPVALAVEPGPAHVVAFIFVVIGLAFKIAAVPMHFYTADVYQGAASPMTALLAFLPKISGFFALILIVNCFRGLAVTPAGLPLSWLIWVLAALTITGGNVLALMQKNVKRILAWSSVAHSGYMMLGLLVLFNAAAIDGAVAGIIFYIFVYAVATIAAFAVLAQLEKDNDEAQDLADLNGLATRHPALAATLAICIFSLIGMPLTAGFAGKFIIFSTFIRTAAIPQHIVLIVVALLNTAVAAVYYLRIIAACYIDSDAFTARLRFRNIPFFAIVLAAIVTILLGIMPGLLYNRLDRAAGKACAPSQPVVASVESE